jgi:3-dehydroquinate dehydratase/shikimate dehydrogenase
MAQALAELPRVAEEADLVELRLDLIEEPYDLPALLAARGSCPVVVTVRPPDQGGKSPLATPERLHELVRAAKLGAEYVDVEWDAATPEALAALRAAGGRVLVSRHDFSGMPAGLADAWWAELADLGADVVKVVGMAHEPLDCLPVFRVLRQANRPTLAIAMGEAGLATRILALREPTCFLTYGAPATVAGTAPGQVPIADLRTVYHARRLGPETAAYGLLGPHPEPERAAEYNAWFEATGLDAVAVPFPCLAEAATTVGAFRELPVSGWHVHGEPLQRDVVSALDELDAKASRQGKVNAVVDRDGALLGSWVESPAEQFAFWTGLHTAIA